MHRPARQAKQQDAKLENKAPEEPKAKKSRSSNRTSKIASMDNGTMVETFKYLNYSQLATNSLVSKRFLDVIRTHRYKLALLYVYSIRMERNYNLEPAVIKIFNKELSPQEYKEWVVRNDYSKLIALTTQTAVDPADYELIGTIQKLRAPAFYAHMKELNNETWPLFAHFIRLLSDPFVSIRAVKLSSQTDIFNLLAATIDRLQCKKLEFYDEGNAQKFFNWIKHHVRCDKLRLAIDHSSAYRDKQLLDFFVTGSHCTSETFVTYSHLSKVVLMDLMKKFVGLKTIDEYQMVEIVCGDVSKPTAEALKSKYAKFYVNEESYQFLHPDAQVFEIVNADIGKKLILYVKRLNPAHHVILEILNL